MSILVVTAFPEPEHRAEVVAAFETAIDSVHHEHGVRLYALHEGADRLVMIEQYESEEARAEHLKGAPLARLLAALEGKLNRPLDAQLLEPHPFGDPQKGAVGPAPRAFGSADPGGPGLSGQTVVVIGGSAGIGLATARLARAQGADVVLTARNQERLEHAASDVGALHSAAFEATDSAALDRFFDELPGPIDHVMVTAGRPYYGPLADMDVAAARRSLDEHLWLPVRVARHAVGTVRPSGTLIFMGGTGARRPAPGLVMAGAGTAALPALVANLALEIAPIRVNLIAAGFVDTPLSASLLGDDLEERRAQLRNTLPIGRVVQPEDVAALAVQLMTNTALTGGTYDVDGGQQLLR
jgi:NAD(P)-dependent dehydrogenase (short-subunit alcohol dehydrogenase family)/quinol monooxygenase YgiN